jgi:hypothetical protein
MIDEVLELPEETNKLAWQSTKVAHAAKHEDVLEKRVSALPDDAVKYQVPKIRKFKKLVHDVLSFGGGVSRLSVCSWWILGMHPYIAFFSPFWALIFVLMFALSRGAPVLLPPRTRRGKMGSPTLASKYGLHS